jgi:hypothetical protein
MGNLFDGSNCTRTASFHPTTAFGEAVEPILREHYSEY